MTSLQTFRATSSSLIFGGLALLVGCSHDNAPASAPTTPDVSSASTANAAAAPKDLPASSGTSPAANGSAPANGAMAYDRDGAPHTCLPLTVEAVGNAPLCAKAPAPPDRELYKACQDAGFKILKCGECKEYCSGVVKAQPAHP